MPRVRACACAALGAPGARRQRDRRDDNEVVLRHARFPFSIMTAAIPTIASSAPAMTHMTIDTPPAAGARRATSPR